jgi:hypothetical protein
MRRVGYGVGMSLDGFIADVRDDTARSNRLTLTHQKSFPSGLLMLHYDVERQARSEET